MNTINRVATKEATGQIGIGDLPEWDLADLYPGNDSPELARDLASLDTAATAFRARYYRGTCHLPPGLHAASRAHTVADGDGPKEVNGYFLLRTSTGDAPNPLWQFDGNVELLDTH